jgi:hypothetical protein
MQIKGSKYKIFCTHQILSPNSRDMLEAASANNRDPSRLHLANDRVASRGEDKSKTVNWHAGGFPGGSCAEIMKTLLTFHLFFLLKALSCFSLNYGSTMSIKSRAYH